MACQLPVLLSDIIAFKHIKPALKTSFDIENIQDKINYFFSLSKKQREEMGKQLRDFVLKECSYNAVKDKYIKYYLD